MRLLPLLILVVALLLGSVANTVLKAFRRFSPTVESDRIIWDELLVGHVHHLILASRAVKKLKRHVCSLKIWLFTAYGGQFSVEESGICGEKSSRNGCDLVATA